MFSYQSLYQEISQSQIKPLNDDLSNTERKELIILKTKKVPLFDKQVIRQFVSRSATLFAILSAVLIFVDIPVNLRLIAGGVVLLVLVAIYFLTWHRANTLNDISISVGATTVQIKSGDLFKQDGLKAIAFNEYFDTQVDDVIIAKRSLNGQVIEKYFPDIQGLDKQIESDKSLEKGLIEEMNREVGKKKRYKLGSSVLIDDEFILTAFSRFDDDNKAELTIQEYINFLLAFWNEINRLYAQRTVSVPVFGAGITRFRNGFEDIDINELLQIMVWTFKVSKIKFAYPAKLQIIIHEDLLKKVNLYELKENE